MKSFINGYINYLFENHTDEFNSFTQNLNNNQNFLADIIDFRKKIIEKEKEFNIKNNIDNNEFDENILKQNYFDLQHLNVLIEDNNFTNLLKRFFLKKVIFILKNLYDFLIN